MRTKVAGDLSACLPGGPVCGLMYLVTWPPVCWRARVRTNIPGDLAACLPGGPECDLMYLVTWPPVCQEGQCAE